MIALLGALLLGLVALAGADFVELYLNGTPGLLSQAIQGASGLDAHRYLSWWFGGAMSIGALYLPAAYQSLTLMLSRLPGVDAEVMLRYREAARWSIRACVALVPAAVAHAILFNPGGWELTRLPYNALILMTYSLILGERLLEAWPPEAEPLSPTHAVLIPAERTGRFKVEARVMVVLIPVGGGRRRAISTSSGWPVFKTDRYILLAWRAGFISDTVPLVPVQAGSFLVLGSRRWEFFETSSEDLSELDPYLFTALDTAKAGWADAEAPTQLRQRLPLLPGLRNAQWVLMLERALHGVQMVHHQGRRASLAAACRSKIDTEIASVRGTYFQCEIDDLCGLAKLRLRIDEIETINAGDPSAVAPSQVDFASVAAYVSAEQWHELQRIGLGGDEKSLMNWIASQLVSLYGPGTIDGLIDETTPAGSHEGSTVIDWYRSRSDDDRDEALRRLIDGGAPPVVNAAGHVVNLVEKLAQWEEMYGLASTPNHSSKRERFIEENGDEYWIAA